jgi:hypothetical protein
MTEAEAIEFARQEADQLTVRLLETPDIAKAMAPMILASSLGKLVALVSKPEDLGAALRSVCDVVVVAASEVRPAAGKLP